MARLTKAEKTLVVERLACYDQVEDVVALVKDRFGTEASRHQVAYYDPTSATGGQPGEKWRQLFEDTRRKFGEDTSDVAIAQKRWRLDEYQRMYRTAIDMNNIPLALDIMEQVAKEVGGKFTNTKNLVHSGQIDLTELSDEQVDRLAEGEPAREVIA